MKLEQKDRNKAVRKIEKGIAQALNGKRHALSGGGDMPSKKSDCSTSFWQVEAKSTWQKKITVSSNWVGKICAEAESILKEPVIVICFTGDTGYTYKDVPSQWSIFKPESLQKAFSHGVSRLDKWNLVYKKFFKNKTILLRELAVLCDNAVKSQMSAQGGGGPLHVSLRFIPMFTLKIDGQIWFGIPFDVFSRLCSHCTDEVGDEWPCL